MSQENSPSLEQVRISEIKELLSEIEQFESKQMLDVQCPIIIAGDFNSIAYGDVYQYMISQGYTPAVFSSMTRILPFQKKPQSYPHNILMPATTKTMDRYTWIDYIWIRNANYKLQQKIELVKSTDVWPDQNHPSDHAAIGTTLYI